MTKYNKNLDSDLKQKEIERDPLKNESELIRKTEEASLFKVIAGFLTFTTAFFGMLSFLLLLSNFLPGFAFINRFNLPQSSVRPEVLSIIKNHSISGLPDEQSLLEAELRGLVSGLDDPHSLYIPQSENNNFRDILNQRYEGVGILFETVDKKNIVQQVFNNSPAKNAGVKSGDVLLTVDGEDVKSEEIGVVAGKIRGERGTTVVLEFLREGEVKKFEITRDRIELELVSLSLLKNNTVAHLKISSFGDNMSFLMEEKIKLIKEKPVEYVIVDVRGNGGGLLNETVDVVSHFIPENEIVVREKTADREKVLRSSFKSLSLKDYKIIVLVDGFSASASEILAGALREHLEAKLIGQTTFGKGTVQQIFNLSNGDKIKLTIAEWFTPNGIKIDQIGLKPDVEVDEEKDALDKALELINDK